MQWLIDIIIEYLQANGYLLPAYIDRGDPAAFDFIFGDFTIDSLWHDLDLSAIVPDGAQAVHMFCTIRATGLNKWIQFREKGNVNVINLSQMQTKIANIPEREDIIVKLDSNRVIEYRAVNVRMNIVNLTIRGWWL